MTPALNPTISPMPGASIDTLISSIAWFSTILLAVIGSIGAFLVWNGFVLRARAEKDLDRIEETARKSEKIFAEYKQRTDEVFKVTDELMSSLLSEISKVKEHGKRVEASAEETQKTAEEAQKEWEKIKTVYSNISLGTTVPYYTAPYQANGYPFNPAVYANPNATPIDIHGKARIVTGAEVKVK